MRQDIVKCLNPPFHSKSIGQRSFTFLGPKLYNEIPETIKKINACGYPVFFGMILLSQIVQISEDIRNFFLMGHPVFFGMMKYIQYVTPTAWR
ncbi:hypothetical protein NQ317_017576 [Molorchus minor]|uniref:Uncharacterized protein n=1 Tax=Molorchus minor TaxID=1323400 RepID=A0ABQ9JQT8_9CUCU|nr:hypothetical protein NQ317_017576 [Molorchus minor]